MTILIPNMKHWMQIYFKSDTYIRRWEKTERLIIADSVFELSALQEMVRRRSHQTVLFLREDVPGVASVEQHNEERGRISVRGRHVRRLHHNMRGTVHSALDGRAKEQQENGKAAAAAVVRNAQHYLPNLK